MSNDPPKPLKTLGFRSKVMGNDPPKPLKMLGFRSNVVSNDPPKPLKMLGFLSNVMGRARQALVVRVPVVRVPRGLSMLC